MHVHGAGLPMRKTAAAIACTALLSLARLSSASEAKDAYSSGVAAYGKGDFAEAARLFARADALAPSPVALRAALDAAVKADDPALGSELLERSKRATPDPELARSIKKATDKLAHRAGRIHASCTDCVMMIDGRSVSVSDASWVKAGSHAVMISANGVSVDKSVEVRPDEVVEIDTPRAPETLPTSAPPTSPVVPQPTATTVDATPASQPPVPAYYGAKPHPRGGLSPWFFATGAVLTAGLAAGAIVSGVDTTNRHDAFVSGGCRTPTPPSDCASRANDGSAADTRTVVLTSVAAAMGAATLAVGLFATKWRTANVSAALGPGGAFVSATAPF